MRAILLAVVAIVLCGHALAQEAQKPKEPTSPPQFSLSEVARLMDAQRGHMVRAPTPQERVAILFNQQMQRCWRMPSAPDQHREELTISVDVDLASDGTLASAPRIVAPANWRNDPALREAGEAALRAVQCGAPYPMATDTMVKDRYDLWRTVEFTFRPSVP